MQWKIVNQSGATGARATVEVVWRRGEAASGSGAAPADGRVESARRPVFL